MKFNEKASYLDKTSVQLDRESPSVDSLKSESSVKDVATLLGSSDGKFFIELTLNVPRVPRFNDMSTQEQRKFYMLALYKMAHCLRPQLDLSIDHACFEISKDGSYHCHALLLCNDPHLHFPLGVVADLVRCWVKLMPKQRYDPRCMMSHYQRYRAPSIVCQYKDMDDTEELDRWRTYLRKYRMCVNSD